MNEKREISGRVYQGPFDVNQTPIASPSLAAYALRSLLKDAERSGLYVYCDTPEVSLRIIDARMRRGLLEVKTIGKGIWEASPYYVFGYR